MIYYYITAIIMGSTSWSSLSAHQSMAISSSTSYPEQQELKRVYCMTMETPYRTPIEHKQQNVQMSLSLE